MPYDGFLDANDGWSARGWAIDRARPDDPVEIEYELSSGVSGTVLANQFRADLATAGVGNGCHAFTIELPRQNGATAPVGISARIKGTGFVLSGSPMPQRQRDVVGLIAGDIVNNCNLRCPFCMVDYSNIRGLRTMTEQTFRRAMELMPSLPRGQFWMSCLHEPTLHPRFVDLIEMVPNDLRDRISFTSNLSKRLPDDWLPRIVDSGIHSIRVSFDSRQPDIFAALRKGAKYELFQQNVERLATLLRAHPRRPRLTFITMAFRENYREIPDLIRHGREVLGADSHEIRFLYYMPHLAHWGKEHLLSPEQWNELEAALEPQKATTELVLCGPIEGTREQFEHEQGLSDYIARENAFGGADETYPTAAPDVAVAAQRLPDEPIRLRMRWDGLTVLEAREDLFRANLNTIDQPLAYFDELRRAIRARSGGIGATALQSAR